jgi:hypothetical protein
MGRKLARAIYSHLADHHATSLNDHAVKPGHRTRTPLVTIRPGELIQPATPIKGGDR